MKRAAFLDRDGVINEDRGYVHRPEDFVLLPGVPEALRLLQAANYSLVIVTNQSGLARRLFAQADYEALTRHMLEELRGHGVQIAAVYHCPHLPGGAEPSLAVRCSCRKPLPGMIEAALHDLAIDRRLSFLVGDKASDLAAGRAAGLAATYLVGGDCVLDEATERHDDLLHCVRKVLATGITGTECALS